MQCVHRNSWFSGRGSWVFTEDNLFSVTLRFLIFLWSLSHHDVYLCCAVTSPFFVAFIRLDLAAIECRLSVRNRLPIRLLRLFLLVLFVGHGSRNDIREEFEVVEARYCICCFLMSQDIVRLGASSIPTYVFVLDITSGFPLGFDNIVSSFGEIVHKHFSSDGDHESRIVRAAVNAVVGVDDLLDASNCTGSMSI